MASKPHYAVLDGLRGTAALAIVLFHFTEFVIPDYAMNPLGHGFLAVDFFFCLSGFVIGYAYDDRLKTLSLREFVSARLIRLHPLVILGAALGLIAFIFDPFDNSAFKKAGLSLTALSFLCSILLIPAPLLPGRGGGLFPLNPPTWSLFWEYVANLFYFLVLGRLARIWIVAFAIVSALGLAYVAQRAGTLIGGWGISNIWDGLPRAAYSFAAGLLVYRFRFVIRARLGFFALSAVLLGIFMIPYYPMNWLVETLIVVAVFPVIVACGTGVDPQGWKLGLCQFLGRLSYPLYMTHNMVMFPFGNYYAKTHPQGALLLAILSLGMVALVGMGVVVMRAYDEPLRAWLRRRYLKVRASKAG